MASFHWIFFELIETIGEGFHNEDLSVHLRKIYPNESGSLDRFAFVRWYVEEEVSLESTEEAESFVVWVCKVRLMDLQWAIFLKVYSLKREQDSGKAIFEGVFKFAASEAKKKFDITSSEYQGAIGDRSWRNLGLNGERTQGVGTSEEGSDYQLLEIYEK